MNKVSELPSAYAAAFPAFQAGYLVVSMRQQNLVAVIDPRTWRVVWHSVGPWRRQHDPEFLPTGEIAVFNNNVYRTAYRPNDLVDKSRPRISDVLAIRPTDGASRVIYGNRPGQEFMSVIRGKIDPTTEGGFLITEFDAGRALEIDAQGKIIWDYTNRYDDDFVTKITEARLYPASYFTVKDWTCPAQ